MAEPLFNYWTIEHILFGFSSALIIGYLLRLKRSDVTIPLYIILLWELFEFKNQRHYWVNNIGNQIVDIIVGIIGIYIGTFVYKRE